MRYLLVLLLLPQLALAAPRLTIYQAGIAYVTEELPVAGGTDTIRIEGLPDTLVPDSLLLRDVDVISWSFAPGRAVAPLDALIGREVEAVWEDEVYRGKLVSTQGGLLLEVEGGFIFLKDFTEVRVRDGLCLERPPVLEAKLREPLAGGTVALSYLAGGFGWSASYLGIWDEEEGELEFTGSAAISNSSGRDFAGASVELVAGEVRVERGLPAVKALAMAPEAGAPPAEVSEVGEYHRYALREPVDIPQGTVHVRYLPWSRVAAEAVYRFRGGPIEFFLKFENSTGFPLPAGTFRVYGGGAFLGEARIGHTPEGREVELPLGVAFDLTGERTRTLHRRLAENRYRDAYRIELGSAKDEAVAVEVIEELPGDWEIVSSSLPYETIDASHVLFLVEVPPGGEAVLEYVVEYSY